MKNYSMTKDKDQKFKYNSFYSPALAEYIVQYLFNFENGYGASVIKEDDELYELTVVTWKEGKYYFNFDNVVCNGVCRHKTINEINVLLDKIKALNIDRSTKIITCWREEKMEINNIEVTIKDFERLSKIMTRTIQEIESGNLYSATQMLTIARNSIEKNLIAERNAEQDIKIGDDVEITYLSGEFDVARDQLLGVQCYVDSEGLGNYALQPKQYKDLIVKQWVFSKENLTLI